MAAVFLVTLYEYSPLFYIALVSVCFLVTSALVLGWFGLGVPVILRNSEETESSTRVLKKRMRQVKNPFGLEITNPAAASVTRGVTLTPDCLEDCVLTCYWGCNVQKLHEALQKHVYCFRIKTPQALEDALYNEYLYKQQYFIKRNDKAEKYCQLPEDAQVVDFGPVPRARYPLVALLTLADEEDREIYDIIAMAAVIHIPDESYRLSCRILYQYLLLAQGQYHDLKQLFMSANSPAPSSSNTFPGESSPDRGLLEKAGLAGDEPELQEENSKDCVVCQNGPVNWVLLPCRHTCLCDGCISFSPHPLPGQLLRLRQGRLCSTILSSALLQLQGTHKVLHISKPGKESSPTQRYSKLTFPSFFFILFAVTLLLNSWQLPLRKRFRWCCWEE